MWIPCTLTHAGEELVHLFQWQGVVQRFQRVDGGHHGASFEACGRGETRRPQARQTSDWTKGSRAGRTNPGQTQHPTIPRYSSPWYGALISCSCFSLKKTARTTVNTHQSLRFIVTQASCKNHAWPYTMTPYQTVTSLHIFKLSLHFQISRQLSKTRQLFVVSSNAIALQLWQPQYSSRSPPDWSSGPTVPLLVYNYVHFWTAIHNHRASNHSWTRWSKPVLPCSSARGVSMPHVQQNSKDHAG